MSRAAFDWFSVVASIVGFPAAIGLCVVFWKKVSYVYRVPRYRAEARNRIDLLRLHMVVARRQGGPDASVPLVLSQRIKATQQSLDSLKREANCLWARWHCLWRPDVPLEFLNQLEKDLEAAILQLSANRGAASQPNSQGPPTDSVPQPMVSSFWRNTMRGRKREDMFEVQIGEQGINVSRI